MRVVEYVCSDFVIEIWPTDKDLLDGSVERLNRVIQSRHDDLIVEGSDLEDGRLVTTKAVVLVGDVLTTDYVTVDLSVLSRFSRLIDLLCELRVFNEGVTISTTKVRKRRPSRV